MVKGEASASPFSLWVPLSSLCHPDATLRPHCPPPLPLSFSYSLFINRLGRHFDWPPYCFFINVTTAVPVPSRKDVDFMGDLVITVSPGLELPYQSREPKQQGRTGFASSSAGN
jgi:hypothetical protein